MSRFVAPWLLLPLACHPAVDPPHDPAVTPVSPETEAPTPAADTATAAETDAEPPRTPVVLVTDATTLGALEHLSFGEIVLGHEADSTAALSRDPAFASLTAVIADDLRSDARADPKAGVGMKHPHRQFDRRWLDRDNVHLELVAVVNRIDRQPFAREHCGETRLLYRLAYDAQLPEGDVHSRLPMTFNVVFWQDGASCQEVARRWMAPPDLDATALARWLQSEPGPLAPERLAAAQLEAVEIDLQSVRWPSAVRPRMAGHAEYLLRVFHREGDRFVPAPLENTPDVERLRRDEPLRARMVQWLQGHAAALDEGTAVLPDEFLATRGTSVTPRGFARAGNRPFSQLVSPAELADLDYRSASMRHVRSPAAMLRRLDGLSCGGCHESRSVAGFHVVGEEPPGRLIDAVAVPISPHLAGDLPRRERVLLAFARGETPPEDRPLSEHDVVPGALGTHCGLGDPGLDAWRCADGLTCRALGDDEMGVCVRAEAPGAGDPCEVGTMHADADPHRDWVSRGTVEPCRDDIVCNTNAVGFPEGMCTASCSDLADGETCGAIVGLHPFNRCVGRRRPFPVCITENARPAGMQACDRLHPCRDDYICARSPYAEPDAEGGACLPPYFLFQLRVDGHVM